MSKVLVQKYGGSSVATVEKLGLVADQVIAAKKAGFRVVVAVSAMGKATDQLIALAKSVASEPPRRELDMLVSTGERVSMALLSIAIQSRGHNAISFTGSQSGIITSDRHFDARIIEVRPQRIEEELEKDNVVIVAGYQGVSEKREITTLGRGGTDTTAVALAAALHAERCEIYSDVDGVYSADPRVVADAMHLPEIDLASLQEMAEAGAKVLNAQAVEWARRANIAIYARKTGDFIDASGHPAKQTVARPFAAEEKIRARAVVGLANVVVIEAPRESASSLFETAARLSLPLLDVTMTAHGATCALPLLNVPHWETSRGAIVSDVPGVRLSEGRALLSVVGDGLVQTGGVPKFLAVLASLGASLDSLSAGPLRISAMIATDKLDGAQRALHATFVTD